MMPHIAKRTTQTDYEIGQAIRTVRSLKGMSQTDLGTAAGVTFQQIQKYEKGANRLSVATLIKICQALEISPMEIIGPHIGQPSAMLDSADQVTTLKRRLSDIARIATKG
jgi:transcriptional regulator with XRE-family HTH domain